MEGRVTQIKYLLLKERERERKRKREGGREGERERKRKKEIYFFGNSKITSNTGVRNSNNMQQTIRSKTYHF
jgi:hypothetical protein